MGGFSILLRNKEIQYLNLPGRNRFLEALMKNGGLSVWSKGVIWKCNNCMSSEIKMQYFLDGLKTINNDNTWIGAVAKVLIQKLQKSKSKSIKIEDGLMACEHKDVSKFGG